MLTGPAAAPAITIDSSPGNRPPNPAPQALQRDDQARVPGTPCSGFSEPTHFRLLHHAHLVLTEGTSLRLAEATAGKGVTPLT